MNNIYLIGFMGSGKSAAAAYLMREYGMPRVDMDREIEADSGMSIPDIFAEQGEEAFRVKETHLLKKIAEREDLVVSCGGGVILRRENVDLMRQSGTIVYLSALPETILQRVRRSDNRPILEGKKTIEDIRELMERRRNKYEKAADVTVATDGRSVAEVAEEVLRMVRKDLPSEGTNGPSDPMPGPGCGRP